jgi:histone H3/H4
MNESLTNYQAFVASQIDGISSTTMDWKSHILPLARIKKIMKSEDEIKDGKGGVGGSKLMISSEGPILFAKACEMFIGEIAIRSWITTEESKRRTVQKTDVNAALSRNEMFDFLIDIIGRVAGVNREESTNTSAANAPQLYPSPSLPLPVPSGFNSGDSMGRGAGTAVVTVDPSNIGDHNIGSFMALMANQQQQMQAQYHRHRQLEQQQAALGYTSTSVDAEDDADGPPVSTITEEQQKLLMEQFQAKAMAETGFLLLKEEAERLEKQRLEDELNALGGDDVGDNFVK